MAKSESKFWLVDAVEWQKECPTTFDLPDEWNRKHLKVGEWAKLIFAFPTKPEDSFERMWVRIDVAEPTWYGGTLDNEPSAHGFISIGHRLRFEPRHVIDIRPPRMSLHPSQLELRKEPNQSPQPTHLLGLRFSTARVRSTVRCQSKKTAGSLPRAAEL